jgi:hypothetical protein
VISIDSGDPDLAARAAFVLGRFLEERDPSRAAELYQSAAAIIDGGLTLPPAERARIQMLYVPPCDGAR